MCYYRHSKTFLLLQRHTGCLRRWNLFCKGLGTQVCSHYSCLLYLDLASQSRIFPLSFCGGVTLQEHLLIKEILTQIQVTECSDPLCFWVDWVSWIGIGNHMISSAKLFWRISECSLVAKAYKIEQACWLSAIIGSLIGSLYVTC